jgi:hypothetical protein
MVKRTSTIRAELEAAGVSSRTIGLNESTINEKTIAGFTRMVEETGIFEVDPRADKARPPED